MEGPMMWSLAATTALDMGSNKQVASKLNGEAYLSMHFAMQFVTLMTSKKKKHDGFYGKTDNENIFFDTDEANTTAGALKIFH